MSMLTDSELAQIRADVADLLPDTGGAVLEVTQTADGMGGFTEAWGTAAGTLAYRLDPLTGQEAERAGALNPSQSFMLTLPHDTTISTENRFEDSAGARYAVIGEDRAKSWRASVRVMVEAV